MRVLAKFFPRDYGNPAVRRHYGVLSGAVGIALNVLLFAAKYFAGVLSKSIAITADAFNNLSDAGSSLIALLGFKIAGRKADAEHPFGHGLAEHVAGLIVAIAIILMGFDLGRTSIRKILSPEPVEFSALSTAILAGSILVKLSMTLYNRSIGKKIRSATMRATATDSLSDAFATLAVLCSTLIAHFTGLNIDGWTGALVAAMILWAGWSAARDTVSPLLGCAPDPELVRRIVGTVREYKEVVGIHDLLVHAYGAGNLIVSLHAEVNADGNFAELHDVIDVIERRLQRELNCHAVIHMDPLATDDSLVGEAKKRVQDAIFAALGDSITIHDFRMVAGPTHTNVIFDAAVPPGYPLSDDAVRKQIDRAVGELEGRYFAIVTIDKPYEGAS